MSDPFTSSTISSALDNASRAALGTLPKQASGKDLDKASKDFEAMFLSQMLSPMWSGLEADGMFDGGSAEQTFRSLLINEYGKTLSQAGGFGIAASVKAELLKIQGGSA